MAARIFEVVAITAPLNKGNEIMYGNRFPKNKVLFRYFFVLCVPTLTKVTVCAKHEFEPYRPITAYIYVPKSIF
jgi:hypothetical protein